MSAVADAALEGQLGSTALRSLTPDAPSPPCSRSRDWVLSVPTSCCSEGPRPRMPCPSPRERRLQTEIFSRPPLS
jgi:hypothetical protein